MPGLLNGVRKSEALTTISMNPLLSYYSDIQELTSPFRDRRSTLDKWNGKNAKVKMYKTPELRSAFWSCDVEKNARRCGPNPKSENKRPQKKGQKTAKIAYKSGGPILKGLGRTRPIERNSLQVLSFVKFDQDDNLCCRTLNPKP